MMVADGSSDAYVLGQKIQTGGFWITNTCLVVAQRNIFWEININSLVNDLSMLMFIVVV